MERKNVQEKEMNITHYYPLGGIIAYHLSGLRRLLSERAQRYDYGARQYDCTRRVTTPDPLAKKYLDRNMYDYCMNNSVRYLYHVGINPKYFFKKLDNQNISCKS